MAWTGQPRATEEVSMTAWWGALGMRMSPRARRDRESDLGGQGQARVLEADPGAAVGSRRGRGRDLDRGQGRIPVGFWSHEMQAFVNTDL